MSRLRFGWTLEFLDPPADGLTFRFWSGEGDLTIAGVVYKGMNGAIGITPPGEKASEAVKLTGILDATDPAIRLQLRRDLGPLRIKLGFIYADEDAPDPAWKPTGKQFVGRLSAPVLQGSTYTIDAESLITDLDRGRIRNWSDDTQRARHPGDRGMEFLQTYGEGIQVKWPR